MIFNIKSRQVTILMIVIQVLMAATLLLNYIGLNIPLLRQCIGFIYLTFVPGFIILKLLKVNISSIVEKICYSVGLSISFTFFVGLLLNALCPFLGINKPLNLFPIVSAFLITTFLLSLFVYIHDIRTNKENLSFNFEISNSILFLFLIPFLSISGAFLANYYNIRVVLFILLIIISLIPLIVTSLNWPKKELYPLLIYVLSISLLFHWSLISLYLTGADIHYEYYYSNLVNLNNVWDPTFGKNVNSLLSIVLTPTIYSQVLNLDLTWVFKVVYPLIYAFVPVCLYQIFQKQINRKISLLAVFYFISISPFFMEMTQLARQEIAELFFVLLILLMIDRHLDEIKKSILLIIFSFSLVMSHYGLAYVYLFLLFSIPIIWFLNRFLLKFNLNMYNLRLKTKIHEVFPINFSILFFVMVFAWYMYITNADVLSTIVHIGNQMISSMYDDFFNPTNLQGIAMLTYKYSIFHTVTKYLYIISQFLIVLGVLSLLKPLKVHLIEINFSKIFTIFSFSSLLLLILCLIMPYFASSLNTTRLFHISLFFLAPFVIIGLLKLFEIINNLLKREWNVNSALKIISLFLMVFLLLNSGLVYELVDDEPSSIALHDPSNMDFPYYTTEDMNSAIWINMSINKRIYTDSYGKVLLNQFIPYDNVRLLTPTNASYFFYSREINTKQGSINIVGRENTMISTRSLDLNNYTKNMNLIFSNGGANVYWNVGKY